MRLTISQLAAFLSQAEEAHKLYEGAESGTVKTPWPTFYAEWLLDNTPLGQTAPTRKREWDVERWNGQDKLALFAASVVTIGLLWAIS